MAVADAPVRAAEGADFLITMLSDADAVAGAARGARLGPEEGRERCGPVFGAIGSKTAWLGHAGAGSRLKLVVNDWVVGSSGCCRRP